jgi:hypothetical protein
MNQTIKTLKKGNMPTTIQMRLLHWLTQLELSEDSADESVLLTLR